MVLAVLVCWRMQGLSEALAAMCRDQSMIFSGFDLICDWQLERPDNLVKDVPILLNAIEFCSELIGYHRFR